jgi:hypothetical protein
MNDKTCCCPKFDAEPWNEKEIVWQDKLFIKDRVKSIFRIPLNFGSIMNKNMKLIESSGAKCPDNIVITDENSLWGADVYIAVDKEIPGAATGKISGNFLTKVFEGPYSSVGKWIKEMQSYVASKGKSVSGFYFWYTTCPKCAKKYGKNYIVIFARI